MKKTNNKFRSNGGNNHHSTSQVYSLNYKFDSHSMAGKCCDTALNLIKRYNDLARDAIGNSDRVAAEIFRQYAEHYRKILTEINEKRVENNSFVPQVKKEENSSQDAVAEATKEEKPRHHNNKFKRDDKPRVHMPRKEPKVAEIEDVAKTSVEEIKVVQTPKSPIKEFKIVEVAEASKNSVKETSPKPAPKPKRIIKKKEELQIVEQVAVA